MNISRIAIRVALLPLCVALALPIAAAAQSAPPPPPPTTPPAPPAPPAHGDSTQRLQLGDWTGTANTPDGAVLALAFHFTAPADSLVGELAIDEFGLVTPLTAIRQTGRTLTFAFVAGDSNINCALERKDDGTYAGSCTDAYGEAGTVTMVPPAKKPAAQ
jgi:hypothetical protein